MKLQFLDKSGRESITTQHRAGFKGMNVIKPFFCLGSLLVMSLLALLAPGNVYAQRFEAAAVAGLNACQVDGDDLAGFDKVGLTGGFKAIVLFESRFRANMEFLYSERGSRPDVLNPEYDPSVHINLKYIELPVYFSYGDWWQEEDEYYKVAFHGGFSYGRLMDASTIDEFHSPDMSLDLLVPYFNENDVSWLVGFDYRFSPRWGLNARYTHGITPLLSPEKHDLNAPKLVSYFLTFRFEYYFK